MAESWNEIKPRTVIGSWHKLLPVEQQPSEQLSSEQTVSEVVNGIVEMAQRVGGEGFADVEENEVVELVEPVNEALSVEEIEIIIDEPEENERDEPEESQPVTFSAKSIVRIIQMIEDALDEAIENDPIMIRSLKFKNDCEIAVRCYRELYSDTIRRAKQCQITQYFTKK